jgi:membrane protein YdbS with pleckstrin-like domain
MPAVWSTLLALPFLALGGYLYALQSAFPEIAGAPLLVFGAFISLVGLYVQFIGAPEPPTMSEDEEIIETRNPAQRSALATVLISFPVLGTGIYLLYFTGYPYVYPTVAFLVGLYLFSNGLHAYWTNTLTTYLVTNQRIIQEYRFLSLLRTEVPIDKVRGVSESRSPLESLVGLGNVTVQSGGGDLKITVRNIYRSTEFADTVRSQLD